MKTGSAPPVASNGKFQAICFWAIGSSSCWLNWSPPSRATENPGKVRKPRRSRKTQLEAFFGSAYCSEVKTNPGPLVAAHSSGS